MARKSRDQINESNRVRSQEMLLLQHTWREAFRRGGMSVRFPSQAGAVRARMQLYNAVKLQKTGKDMRDLELVHAAEQLEIVWVDEVTIRFQLRAKSDMMVGLQEVLGMKLGEFVEPDALESSQKILEELEKMGLAASPAPNEALPEPQPQKSPELQQGHKPNPFFDRSKDE